MGRSPCCDDKGLKKGPWTQEEDEKLTSYIQKHGHGSWRALPKNAGLNRCGKSCRLRWTNYLRPDIKRGRFTEEEEEMIIKLHSILGNKWSRIAAHLPGRTDNEIKNYWNTHLRKKLLQMGIDPVTHRPRTDLSLFSNLSHLLSSPMTSLTNNAMMNNYPHDLNAFRLQSNAAELAKIRVLQNIISILHTSPTQNIDQSAMLLGLSSNTNNQQLIEKLLACPNPNPNGPSSSMNTPPISDEAVLGYSTGASGATKSETEQCGAFYESWAGIGGENYSDKAMKMDSYEQGCSSGNPALAEHKLPGLVSASSTETWSINENIASNANSTIESIQSFPADADFLEGWEKLIDDGTSESFFWKDLLN